MRPDEKRLPQDARVSTLISTQKDLDLRANLAHGAHQGQALRVLVDAQRQLLA